MTRLDNFLVAVGVFAIIAAAACVGVGIGFGIIYMVWLLGG